MEADFRIYRSLLQGDQHSHHCDDYVFAAAEQNKVVAAVMDGCSNGIESYFAATLTGKVMRKVVRELFHEEFTDRTSLGSEVFLKRLMQGIIREMRIIKTQLQLENKALLTTLIVLVYDHLRQKGMIVNLGDGLISVNGTLSVFDQDNRPDYFAYHLEDDFEQWYAAQHFTSIGPLYDVSLATDGIATFQQMRPGDQRTIDPIDFLLHDRADMSTDSMLDIKIKTLEQEYALRAYDDVGIVRIAQLS